MNIESRINNGYIPEIDGLRSIAVLCVLLYHLRAAYLPGGFTGVDVFFVISGYVVSRSLERDASLGVTAFLQRFYARRFLRILPALFICLLVTSAFTIFFIPEAWLSESIRKTGLAAFFGISNFALLSADSYFSPRPAFNPFTHTWSLGVEEQFYLVYPLLLFMILRARRHAGTMRLATAVLPALLIVSFAGFCWISKHNPEQAFYMLPYRFWELAAGAFCLQRQEGGLRLAPAISRGLAFLGLLLIVLAAWLGGVQAGPTLGPALAVAGAFSILLSLPAPETRNWPIARFLRNPVCVHIGKLSYSLYLWHWPVFVMFRWTTGLLDAPRMLAAVALSFALAELSYRFVERPFRGAAWVKSRPPYAILGAGLVCALLFHSIARHGYRSEGSLSVSVVMRHSAEWYPTPLQAPPAAGCTPRWQLQVTGGLAIQTLHLPCGGAQSTRQLFVIGDSHATAYDQMLSMLGQNEHIGIRIYAEAGCSYANLLTPSPPNCLAFTKSVTAKVLETAAPGDAVFFASLRMPRLADQYAETAISIPGMIALQAAPAFVQQRQLAYTESAALVAQYVGRGLIVIIDAPKPVFAAAPFRCADWYDRGNPMCGGLEVSRQGLLALRGPVMQALAQLSVTYPQVAVWDPFPVLCPGETCAAITGAGPLFFDGDHLSNTGNRLLYPSFKAFVDRVWKPKAPAATRMG